MNENVHIYRVETGAVVKVDYGKGHLAKDYETLPLAAKEALNLGLISVTCEQELRGQRLDGCNEAREDVDYEDLKARGFVYLEPIGAS